MLSPESKRSSDLTRFVILAGGMNTGKTTAVRDLVSQLQREKVDVGGFCSPGIWREGQKVGYTLHDFHSSNDIPLATWQDGTRGIRQGRFLFLDEGLRGGREALERSMSSSVIVLDEIGPLELRGEGFAKALERIVSTYGGVSLLVVRNSLVESVIHQFRLTRVVILSIEGLSFFPEPIRQQMEKRKRSL